MILYIVIVFKRKKPPTEMIGVDFFVPHSPRLLFNSKRTQLPFTALHDNIL